MAESRQWIAKDFSGVPEDVTRKIVFENAVKLYRMDLNSEAVALAAEGPGAYPGLYFLLLAVPNSCKREVAAG
jgi:hypothetical protein